MAISHKAALGTSLALAGAGVAAAAAAGGLLRTTSAGDKTSLQVAWVTRYPADDAPIVIGDPTRFIRVYQASIDMSVSPPVVAPGGVVMYTFDSSKFGIEDGSLGTENYKIISVDVDPGRKRLFVLLRIRSPKPLEAGEVSSSEFVENDRIYNFAYDRNDTGDASGIVSTSTPFFATGYQLAAASATQQLLIVASAAESTTPSDLEVDTELGSAPALFLLPYNSSELTMLRSHIDFSPVVDSSDDASTSQTSSIACDSRSESIVVRSAIEWTPPTTGSSVARIMQILQTQLMFDRPALVLASIPPTTPLWAFRFSSQLLLYVEDTVSPPLLKRIYQDQGGSKTIAHWESTYRIMALDQLTGTLFAIIVDDKVINYSLQYLPAVDVTRDTPPPSLPKLQTLTSHSIVEGESVLVMRTGQLLPQTD